MAKTSALTIAEVRSGAGASERLTNPTMPISGISVQMHHGDDPNLIGFIEVDDRIGKAKRQAAPGRRVELAELTRMGTDRHNNRLNLVIETATKF